MGVLKQHTQTPPVHIPTHFSEHRLNIIITIEGMCALVNTKNDQASPGSGLTLGQVAYAFL